MLPFCGQHALLLLLLLLPLLLLLLLPLLLLLYAICMQGKQAFGTKHSGAIHTHRLVKIQYIYLSST